MRNKRFHLVCHTCGAALQDNESYDFRVNLWKSESADIWFFADDEVDLSGMHCNCKRSDEEDWDAIEVV
jgi:hypothetical protein